MSPSDGSPEDNPDQSAHPGRAADERLSAQLAGLRPMQPGADLRSRISATLAAEAGEAEAGARRHRLGAIGERLAWAAAGAVAASLAFLVAGPVPVGREQSAVATAAGTRLVEPAVTASVQTPSVHDEPIGWSDEGIRFVDEFTPARVLRRKVIERHMAGNGAAEVRVPREDVFLLPVALR